MQRLKVLEKKVSKIHVVVSRESVRLGLSAQAVATGERPVSVAGCAFIIFIILLAWAVAVGRDQLFKTRLPLTTDFTLNIPNISSFLTFY